MTTISIDDVIPMTLTLDERDSIAWQHGQEIDYAKYRDQMRAQLERTASHPQASAGMVKRIRARLAQLAD